MKRGVLTPFSADIAFASLTGCKSTTPFFKSTRVFFELFSPFLHRQRGQPVNKQFCRAIFPPEKGKSNFKNFFPGRAKQRHVKNAPKTR